MYLARKANSSGGSSAAEPPVSGRWNRFACSTPGVSVMFGPSLRAGPAGTCAGADVSAVGEIPGGACAPTDGGRKQGSSLVVHKGGERIARAVQWRRRPVTGVPTPEREVTKEHQAKALPETLWT
jgi:hypothetical protein